MSDKLYGYSGLRFWSETEIESREYWIKKLLSAVKEPLLSLNQAWSFERVEGPVLTPEEYINPAYGLGDVFKTQTYFLRPETTASSYIFAKNLLKSGKRKAPLCVWQAGKSFRVESNDGASGSKLRFNEFWQLEFQCIYKPGTKADYLTPLVDNVGRVISSEHRIIPSDRLPDYSESTTDIEVMYKGKWKEMASISVRKDYPEMHVIEVAVGLDRLISVFN